MGEVAGGFLLDRDADNAGLKHMKRARSAQGDVDNAAFDERPAIIDATADRMTGIGNRHDGSEGSRAMRASHFVGASDPIVIRGETIFRTGRNGISKQKYKKKCGELHDQKLARTEQRDKLQLEKRFLSPSGQDGSIRHIIDRQPNRRLCCHSALLTSLIRGSVSSIRAR